MSSVLRWLLLATLLCVTGCASLSRPQHEQAAAIALAARTTEVSCEQADRCATRSPLHALGGKAISESSPVKPQHYATIVDHGEESLVARLNLINSATRSIDLQTYIFDKDDSSRVILDALLAAANRGVKVRVLIDQLSAIPDLRILAALAGAHSNFELRIYNPTFGKAKLDYLDYAGSVLCCFRRFNQRMHNKLLVVDNVAGMVGGRNYQDDYFDWDDEYNFRDRDVIVVGPEARAMATNFNAFWAAKRSVPVERLNDVGRLLLDQGVPSMPQDPWRRPDRVERVRDEAADADFIRRRFVLPALPVRDVHYYADLPQKHRRKHSERAVSTAPELDGLIAGAQHEVMLQTPYLVLSDQALEMFRSLRQQEHPPRIVVASNSLAATDNPIVYAMSYKYKRRNVRELGFNIYEFKPFPLDAPVDYENLVRDPLASPEWQPPQQDEHEHWHHLLGGSAFGSAVKGSGGSRSQGGSEVDRRLLRTETRPSFLGTHAVNKPLPVTRDGARMGLHAKSMVVDRQVAVIGTHNFDPRSENYNTEGVVVIKDRAFAEALAASIERDISPANSWAVAPRQKLPLVGGLNYGVGKVLESSPILDLWPWRYATNYQFQPGPDCPLPVPRQNPAFNRCYVAVGDFPEVNVGPKWLLVRMLTAFGAGLVPIL